jgi:quercetin dioxygenase-like cupin family protein
MSSPLVQIGYVSNLFCRMMHFEKAGDMEVPHTHEFDHLTLLARGKLSVELDDKDNIFDAPCMIYIKKHKIHKITALTDNTVAYCIHALREPGTGDILDPSMIPEDGPDLSKVAKIVIM